MISTLEVPVEVSYFITPAEPRTMEHPGCDRSITIEEVLVDGHNIIHMLTLDQLASLEADVEAELEDARGQAMIDRYEANQQ